MSEESQIFQSDREPEMARISPSPQTRKPAPALNPQAAQPAPAAEPASPGAEIQAEMPVQVPVPVPMAVPAAAPAPEPELELKVDDSILWHAPSALQQRIANLQSTAAATAHQLDEQEEASRKIAQHLKGLKSQ